MNQSKPIHKPHSHLRRVSGMVLFVGVAGLMLYLVMTIQSAREIQKLEKMAGVQIVTQPGVGTLMGARKRR